MPPLTDWLCIDASAFAYANGHDDFARIDQVPVMIADLNGARHGGTCHEPNGGVAAQVVADWLEWPLFGDSKAGAQFAGLRP